MRHPEKKTASEHVGGFLVGHCPEVTDVTGVMNDCRTGAADSWWALLQM